MSSLAIAVLFTSLTESSDLPPVTPGASSTLVRGDLHHDIVTVLLAR